MEDQLICEGVNSKGFGIIPKLVMQDRTMHATAKCIYAYFCSFAGAGALCFPTRSKICFDLGISIDTFGKYLKQLIEHGYIKCEQFKENGRFSHNVYTICSTISPCPKISDTETIVYDNLDTNNNNNKNNNIINNNNKSKETPHQEKAEPKQEQYTQTESVVNKIKKIPDETIRNKLLEIMRTRERKGKPITHEVLRMILERLNQYSGGNKEKQIEILDVSVMNGYDTVFPLNSYNKHSKNYQYPDESKSYDVSDWEKSTSGDDYLLNAIDNLV